MKFTLSELIREHHKMMLEQGFHDPRLSDLELLTLIVTEIGKAVNAYRKNDWFLHKKYVGSVIVHGSIHGLVDPFLIKDAMEIGNDEFFSHVYKSHIKDTVEGEFADICLRIFDFMGLHEIWFNEIIDTGFAYNGVIIKNTTWNDKPIDTNCDEILIPVSELNGKRNDFGAIRFFERENVGTFLEKCGKIISVILAPLMNYVSQCVSFPAPGFSGKVKRELFGVLACIFQLADDYYSVDLVNHILAAMRFNGTRPKKHDKLF